jgi:hypothetical protein
MTAVASRARPPVAPEVRGLSCRDRYSPAKYYWVYSVEDGAATLYRTACPAVADKLVRLLVADGCQAGRIGWLTNLWWAAKQAASKGWTVVRVVE